MCFAPLGPAAANGTLVQFPAACRSSKMPEQAPYGVGHEQISLVERVAAQRPSPAPVAARLAAAGRWLRDTPDQSPGLTDNAWQGISIRHPQPDREGSAEPRDTRVLGRRNTRRRVFLWRSRDAPSHRSAGCPWQPLSSARRRRHHHRHIGRQFHRPCLWPVWRQAFRRIREALPEAKHPGRIDFALAEPFQLGFAASHRRRPVGNWQPASTTRSCSKAQRLQISNASKAPSSS